MILSRKASRALKDFTNLLFAGLILRMCFAGVDDLQSAPSAGDGSEPLKIGEQKINTLVGRRPARKTDGE